MVAYQLDGLRPVVDPSAFVHPSAVLIGDVIVGARCYVGPCATLRGDFGRILLKTGSNIQDNCTMHSFPGRDAVIEEDGLVGHGAILHGCQIGRDTLIGMNSVIMDDVEIGEGCIIAALSFVKARTITPPRTLWAGSPARLLREVTASEAAWKEEGAREYHQLAERCRASMFSCEPLTEIEPDRPSLPGDYAPLANWRQDRCAK